MYILNDAVQESVSFYSTETENQEDWGMFPLMLFSKRKKKHIKKKSKGLNGVCIYQLCFWHVWGLVFFNIHKRTANSVVFIDDHLQKLQQRDGPLISSAFLTDYFADVQKLLFLENNLFFYFYPFSFWKKKEEKKTPVNFFATSRPN